MGIPIIASEELWEKKTHKFCVAQSKHLFIFAKSLSSSCSSDLFYAIGITMSNKANLRDLIAATSLVILLKFDPNHRFFSPCDLEIWWMASQHKRAPLLYHIKLRASFRIHRWIQTEVTVRQRSIQVKIDNFFSCVTLKFDGWPWKTIGHLFYVASSLVHHFIAISEFKLE